MTLTADAARRYIAMVNKLTSSTNWRRCRREKDASSGRPRYDPAAGPVSVKTICF